MFRSALIFLALTIPVAAASKPRPTHPVDPDYIAALATANKFLHAWQTHDQETAVLLLSDHVREHNNENTFTALFSARTDQAYEVSAGRKLAPGRYQFPVALYAAPSDSSSRHWTHPRATALVIIRTPRNDWLVDKLP